MADTIAADPEVAAGPEVRPETAPGGPDVPTAGMSASDDLVTGELLVEEISIDGMCGVY